MGTQIRCRGRVDVSLEEEDTVVIGVRRALRSAWNLDEVVLETHLPPAPDGVLRFSVDVRVEIVHART